VYHPVISRGCNGRNGWELFFAPPREVSLKDESAPDAVEIIAFARDAPDDPSSGVFHFYALEGGRWRYFGASSDLLKKPGPDQERRCANCHLSGGLVMKELNRPWNGWEVAGANQTPGFGDMVQKLGSELRVTSGAFFAEELMNLVQAGNTAWNKRRIADLVKAMDIPELLRPLFCTTEINLAMGSSIFGKRTSVATTFLVDAFLNHSSPVHIDPAGYQAAIVRSGQVVMTDALAGGQATLVPMVRNGQPIHDTVFPFAYPERSFIDTDFVRQLIDQKIISPGFASAALMVDFAQPVYSDDRCALLRFAPSHVEIAPGATPDAAILDAFVRAIGTPSDPVALGFSKNLQVVKSGADLATTLGQIQAPLVTFLQACADLAAGPDTQAPFLDSLLRIVSQRRRMTRPGGKRVGLIIEHAETLPFDALPEPSGTLRFGPVTCTL
jgi:hypothetical protein